MAENIMETILDKGPGIRWDDIVKRFEYAALERPALEKQLEASSLKSEHKSKVSSHM